MKANICFYCEKACGGCSWSRSFKPVPGWTATPTTHKNGDAIVDTYHITACPEFEPDRDGRLKCKVCGAPLRIGSGRVSFCEKCAPPGDKYHATSNALQRKLKKRREGECGTV